MKLLVLSLLFSFNALAAQINLDCVDDEGVKVATVGTPMFTYASLEVKAEFEHNGELISINVPFGHSSEIPGVNLAKVDDLTIVGISESHALGGQGKMQLDILEHGLSILKLKCETTVNNPEFPRD